MPQIEVISFDADGTLWDFTKVMNHSLAIVLQNMQSKYGARIPESLNVSELIAIRNEVANKYRGEVFDLEEIRRLAFIETLSRIGINDVEYAEGLNTLYLKHRFEDITLYPDVLPCLKCLQGRFKIALISNGNSYPKQCGLDGVFDAVIFSQDYGFEKPDQRLFDIAFETLECEPVQVLHIGDSFENDYQGANNAGAVGVWLNRDMKPIPEDCQRWVKDLRNVLDYA